MSLRPGRSDGVLQDSTPDGQSSGSPSVSSSSDYKFQVLDRRSDSTKVREGGNIDDEKHLPPVVTERNRLSIQGLSREIILPTVPEGSIGFGQHR
ncbi:hypothetical protein INR49_005637 [Caranx melampygus]|nr:hypothetical protein INR49_005637 [Caranx melampygus]